MRLRADLALLASLIPPGSRVLDLGCGDGALLSHLMAKRGCSGTGVERDPGSVLAAIRAGVPVIELDLDSQLDEFADRSYDVVILSRTLQVVRKPGDLLPQLARIGDLAMVSMPNFGYWRNRLRLLRGRMPMSRDLPYAWHDTPNLHFSTLADLEPLFAQAGLLVERRLPLTERGRPRSLGRVRPNLLAASALYVLRSDR
ncbi:MAG: methionine biosynthesis protein MetW [Propionibacteriaceae bacterium]|nr:methionine biosynthesis protein MetW [Propionibacteriaceae bacterium]